MQFRARQRELEAAELVERSPERDHHQVAFVAEQLHERRSRPQPDCRRPLRTAAASSAICCRSPGNASPQPRPVDAEHAVQEAPAFERLRNERVVRTLPF